MLAILLLFTLALAQDIVFTNDIKRNLKDATLNDVYTVVFPESCVINGLAQFVYAFQSLKCTPWFDVTCSITGECNKFISYVYTNPNQRTMGFYLDSTCREGDDSTLDFINSNNHLIRSQVWHHNFPEASFDVLYTKPCTENAYTMVFGNEGELLFHSLTGFEIRLKLTLFDASIQLQSVSTKNPNDHTWIEQSRNFCTQLGMFEQMEGRHIDYMCGGNSNGMNTETFECDCIEGFHEVNGNCVSDSAPSVCPPDAFYNGEGCECYNSSEIYMPPQYSSEGCVSRDRGCSIMLPNSHYDPSDPANTCQ